MAAMAEALVKSAWPFNSPTYAPFLYANRARRSAAPTRSVLNDIRDNGLELERTLERFESTLLSDETAVSFVENPTATKGSFSY